MFSFVDSLQKGGIGIGKKSDTWSNGWVEGLGPYSVEPMNKKKINRRDTNKSHVNKSITRLEVKNSNVDSYQGGRILAENCDVPSQPWNI